MSRIERIEAEMAKQIALVIQQDGVKDPRVKGLISVLRVTVDTELSYAKVYVSILGADGHEQDVVDGLNNAEGFIKSRLNKKMRLRALPELHFIYDDALVYGAYMNQKLTDSAEKKDV